jgi:hypothetical protein
MAVADGARTKNSSSRGRSKPSSRSRNGSSAKQKQTRAAKQRQTNTSRRRGASAASHAPAANPPMPKATALREEIQQSVQHSARDATQVLSKAAKKATTYSKTPILAGGTALAGAAGGLALGTRMKRPHKVLGVEIPRDGFHIRSRDMARTVRRVGKLTETAGHIAAELRQANERDDRKMHLSPIEVLLRGLTTRR